MTGPRLAAALTRARFERASAFWRNPKSQTSLADASARLRAAEEAVSARAGVGRRGSRACPAFRRRAVGRERHCEGSGVVATPRLEIEPALPQLGEDPGKDLLLAGQVDGDSTNE